MNILESVILAALVCIFLTQLVVNDEIFARPREWILNREGWIWWIPKGIAECYRCAGVWLSVPSTALVTARLPWTDGWDGLRSFAVIAASASAIQYGIMKFLKDREPVEPEPIVRNAGMVINYIPGGNNDGEDQGTPQAG